MGQVHSTPSSNEIGKTGKDAAPSSKQLTSNAPQWPGEQNPEKRDKANVAIIKHPFRTNLCERFRSNIGEIIPHDAKPAIMTTTPKIPASSFDLNSTKDNQH